MATLYLHSHRFQFINNLFNFLPILIVLGDFRLESTYELLSIIVLEVFEYVILGFRRPYRLFGSFFCLPLVYNMSKVFLQPAYVVGREYSVMWTREALYGVDLAGSVV